MKPGKGRGSHKPAEVHSPAAVLLLDATTTMPEARLSQSAVLHLDAFVTNVQSVSEQVEPIERTVALCLTNAMPTY